MRVGYSPQYIYYYELLVSQITNNTGISPSSNMYHDYNYNCVANADLFVQPGPFLL